jgi:hypothetical protein
MQIQENYTKLPTLIFKKYIRLIFRRKIVHEAHTLPKFIPVSKIKLH